MIAHGHLADAFSGQTCTSGENKRFRTHQILELKAPSTSSPNQ